MSKRIGILGGTFDPVHLGHMQAAKHVLTHLHLDTIIFIPAFQSPFKNTLPLAEPHHRLHMLKLALADHQEFSLSTVEIDSKKACYTINTLQTLYKMNPKNTKFFLIIGQDCYSGFLQWHKPDEIRKLATLVVVSRPGYKKEMKGSELDNIECLEAKTVNISSSEIRNRLKKNKPVSDWLPNHVKSYIETHHLYAKS